MLFVARVLLSKPEAPKREQKNRIVKSQIEQTAKLFDSTNGTTWYKTLIFRNTLTFIFGTVKKTIQCTASATCCMFLILNLTILIQFFAFYESLRKKPLTFHPADGYI